MKKIASDRNYKMAMKDPVSLATQATILAAKNLEAALKHLQTIPHGNENFPWRFLTALEDASDLLKPYARKWQ